MIHLVIRISVPSATEEDQLEEIRAELAEIIGEWQENRIPPWPDYIPIDYHISSWRLK